MSDPVTDPDDPRRFGDEDVPLPPARLPWLPALLLAFGATAVILVLTIVLAQAFGLEAPTSGGEPTGDEGALLGLSLALLAVHATLLRYGLRRVAGYDVGFGWALLAAVLANVLAALLFVFGLLLSVPIQAAVLRFRSEPHAALASR